MIDRMLTNRARAALVSASIAVAVPLVCAAVGRRPGTAWALRDVLSWLALGAGVVGGLSAALLGTGPRARPDGLKFVSGPAVLVGLLAIPLSLICAIVAGGPVR
jgi:hypothetical protein